MMGQAFDRDGNVLGEAFGDTKREVFDKLIGQFKDAHEIRIRSLGQPENRAADIVGPPNAVQAEMPRYKCRKDVWALKILGVENRDRTPPDTESDGSRWLVVEAPYAAIRVGQSYVRKHSPQAGGYYVVYEDGYQSFSPAKAFEQGYTLISVGRNTETKG